MKYADALRTAELIVAELAPVCSRIEIAGSIRRKRPECSDVEIVCIPHPYQTGLFADGFAEVVGRWKKVKGEPGPALRYTQRLYRVANAVSLPTISIGPEGALDQSPRLHDLEIKVDIFIATPGNWGMIMVYRTGSREFNIRWLQVAKERGYAMSDGQLWIVGRRDTPVVVREEDDLFIRLGMKTPRPEDRA